MEVLNLLVVGKNSVPSHQLRPYANDAPKKTIIGTSIASSNEVHTSTDHVTQNHINQRGSSMGVSYHS